MDVWIPLLSGLVGALIGSLTSIITLVIQSRNEINRAKSRLAVEAGLEDYKQAVAIGERKNQTVPPMFIYIYYHKKILDLLEKDSLNIETINTLNQELEKFEKIANLEGSKRS